MGAKQSHVPDSLLKEIARDIPDNEAIEGLGKELGFRVAEVQNFIKSNSKYNVITNDGTINMLRLWSEGVSPSKCRSELKGALMRAKLVRIAETHLQSASSGVSKGNPKGFTSGEVRQLKEHLQRIYKRMWSDLRTSPLHRESSVELDEIFTHLAMFFEGMGGSKTSMTYDSFTKHLKNICDKEEAKTRIAIFGEAGVGKTTFLAKLTRDWALGRCLEDIDLLFLIPLREIEGNACFGDIIMNMIPDGEEFDGSRVEEYIRKKQNKVLILFDGLDEYGQDISKKTSNDDSISVIRGEKLTSCPVVVTTRTWRAEEVKSITEMEKNYKFVEITGFDRQDVISYISKFFPDNWVARDSLIKLIRDKDSLVAQYMQPYPIYCSMLCYIWHDEGSRTIIQRLETFSQLFQELIHHLIVHYAGKEQNHGTKAKKLKKGEDALRQFAKDALSCLLKNKLVFEEEDLETSEQDLKTVCEIGVLTKVERFVCCRENNRRKTKNVVGYRIPHKLFQDYIAGIHLASLYESNREEFNHLLSKLLEDYRLFTHLFYFTVAQNKEVGRAVLLSLCKVDDVDRISPYSDPCEYHGHQMIFDFIVDVAFECQEIDALEPVILALNKMSSLTIKDAGHTTRGWNFVYKAAGNFAAKRLDDPEVTNVRCGAEAPVRRINVLSSLRLFQLQDVRLDDDFFRAMAISAPQSKLESMRVLYWNGYEGSGISASALHAYAMILCTMPNLQTLELTNVDVGDDFFLTLAETEPAKSGFVGSPVVHLDVGLQSLPILWELNVTSLCPNVKKVSVFVSAYDESYDLGKAWPLYSHNVELHLYGCAWFRLYHVLFAPRTVTRLSVTDVYLTNDGVETLIKCVRPYPHLKNVS
ncbi:uncharacterized protein [Diadema setosum]|uniref:uncharacterized protein n=1 Tax=Diadema setosum TaxID=31175 RepID=UPI003B3B07C2